MTRRAAVAALVLGAILAVTLWPIPYQAPLSARTPVLCLVCGGSGMVDVLANVALFVPLGFALRAAGLAPRRAIGVGLATALLVEILQFAVVSGRDASLSDVITNTAGTALGTWLHRQRDVVLRPDARLARGLALGATLAWLLAQGASALLFRPSAPRGDWWSFWAQHRAHKEPFTGELRLVAVNGGAVPPGPIADTALLAGVIRRGQLELDVTAVAGAPTEHNAEIFGAGDLHGRYLVLLDQRGRDLIFAVRLRASELRFRNPPLRLAAALPNTPGDTVRVRAAFDGRRLSATSSYGAAAVADTLALRASLGWMLVTPIGLTTPRGMQLASAAWVGLWLLAIGYWAALGRRGAVAPALVTIAAGVGLLLVPRLTGAPAEPLGVWLGAAAGAAAGLLLGGAVARKRRSPDLATGAT